MLGQGHIDQNKLRHHFVFRVAQSDNKDSRFVLGEPIARMPPDDADNGLAALVTTRRRVPRSRSVRRGEQIRGE